MGIAGAVLFSLVLVAGRALSHLTSRARGALLGACYAHFDGAPQAASPSAMPNGPKGKGRHAQGHRQGAAMHAFAAAFAVTPRNFSRHRPTGQ